MPLAGAIAERARGIIPVTWDALTRDTRVGDGVLQDAVNLAKEKVTGVVIDPTQEDLYPLVVVDFIAKTAVIEICPAGVDFWMNIANSTVSTGTNEIVAYTDRAARLDELKGTLTLETINRSLEIGKILNFYRDSGSAIPQMSSASINPYHLTPSPEEFPRPWTQTQYS